MCVRACVLTLVFTYRNVTSIVHKKKSCQEVVNPAAPYHQPQYPLCGSLILTHGKPACCLLFAFVVADNVYFIFSYAYCVQFTLSITFLHHALIHIPASSVNSNNHFYYSKKKLNLKHFLALT